MTTVTIKEDGVIEIPDEISKKLNLNNGDILIFKIEEGKIILEKTEDYSIEDVEGSENLAVVFNIDKQKKD